MPAARLAVGARDAFGGHRRDHVVGGEEALLLASEVPVEGGARDARERDDLLDRCVCVPALSDGCYHLALKSCALIQRASVGRHHLTPRGEHAVESLAAGGRYAP